MFYEITQATCRAPGWHVRTQRMQPCKAAVKFKIKKQVEWGDKLFLVGNHKVFGRWEAGNGVELRWNDGDVWTANVKLPDNASVEFKVVNVKGLGDPEWEKGDNRSLSVGAEPLDVTMKWGKTGNGATAPRVKLSHHIEELNPISHSKSPTGSVDGSMAASEIVASDSPLDSSSDDQLPQNKWQGKQIQFMQENKHSKQRSGVWNADGLDGAVLELVKGDEHSGRYSSSSLLKCAFGIYAAVGMWFNCAKH